MDDQHIREMAGSFEFYRGFHSMAYAEEFAQFLQSKNIPCRLEKSRPLLDAAIVGHGLVPPALVKIRSRDFKKVNQILTESALKDPAYVEGHYLQQLDDRELIGIVRKPNDWTVEDAAVARQILNDRGIPIPREHVENFNKKRNEELHRGKKANTGLMFFYFLCFAMAGLLFNPVFLAGGIILGWYYWKDKGVDNQGQRFYTFAKQTRFYGNIIFYLGWLSLVLKLLIVFQVSGFRGVRTPRYDLPKRWHYDLTSERCHKPKCFWAVHQM